MREDLIELAKQQAAEIARAGHNGWGNTMLALAAALEAAREDAELAAKWRLCTSEHVIEGDERITCHINVGVNIWEGAEWSGFQECTPDELKAAIDQARGKGVVE